MTDGIVTTLKIRQSAAKLLKKNEFIYKKKDKWNFYLTNNEKTFHLSGI